MKNIDKDDILIFLGLILLGVGLFFCSGLGIALTVIGILLFGMGFFSGAVRSRR